MKTFGKGLGYDGWVAGVGRHAEARPQSQVCDLYTQESIKTKRQFKENLVLATPLYCSVIKAIASVFHSSPRRSIDFPWRIHQYQLVYLLNTKEILQDTLILADLQLSPCFPN